ncbi:hypothetical protein [Ottowia sp.]|uniref:hypothetical protein n=1 Tax=Ottowia sp. TaxID=1898956 RepID=UPI0025D52873|nr:hypothetical protein [Ottowia sp.]MBK6616195.1 hypothetical protein [Ottowia sp.]
MRTFTFLHQAHSVQTLLRLCAQAISVLPAELASQMSESMCEFETSSAVTMWGIGDINDDPTRVQLSEAEKRQVINTFAAQYSAKDADWDELDRLTQQVLKQRPTPDSPDLSMYVEQTRTGFLISVKPSAWYRAEQWQSGELVASHEGDYAVVRDWIDERLPAQREWQATHISDRPTSAL